ncbi:Metabotropic glutamate receptor-like protein A [Frankliniella fusca]|uniref:Metabotropic glutamate receptor-like protein A n=1 Tax=Frankliniella fusca TaxID=407009 RepID=A0AAE1H2Z1_9NEOP|nr:Metabotropic glutamate receptor-like protein A [Frankliniella fusca]
MSAIRFILLCTLSVFLFSQFVLSRPDEEGSLKSVEAKVSVAVEDLRKNMGELFNNITSYIQGEIAKNPEASEIYKNVTTSLSAVAQQMRDAVASVTPKP